jgi:hypothetical protein
MKILDELPAAVAELGTNVFADIPGTITPN